MPTTTKSLTLGGREIVVRCPKHKEIRQLRTGKMDDEQLLDAVIVKGREHIDELEECDVHQIMDAIKALTHGTPESEGN